MKKIVLMLAMLAVCFSASANPDPHGWVGLVTPFFATDVNVGNADGTGFGWYCEVFNDTLSGHTFNVSATNKVDLTDVNSMIVLNNDGDTPVSPSVGYYDGAGWLFNPGGFANAMDGAQVQYVVYNNADKSLATWYIASSVLALPANTGTPPAPGETDVTFDFGSSAWQAVPEPATFLLFGIGGFGAWLLRRRQQA